MTPSENYFFVNNIEVIKCIDTGIVKYFSTGEGEFVEDVLGRLIKIDGEKRKVVVEVN